MKYKLTETLGYIFCEAAFCWWDIVPHDNEAAWDEENWSLLRRAYHLVGDVFYNTGNYFYSLGDKYESR